MADQDQSGPAFVSGAPPADPGQEPSAELPSGDASDPAPARVPVATAVVNVPGSPIHGETVAILQKVEGQTDLWHAEVLTGPYKGDATTVYPHQCAPHKTAD